MRFEITHSLTYTYSSSVFLEPFTIRLRPHTNWGQQVHQFSLEIAPLPKGKAHCIDLDGNNTVVAWFDGLYDSLSITAESEVAVIQENSFDFIIVEDSVLRIPASYPESHGPALRPYYQPRYKSKLLEEYLGPIIDESEGNTVVFLAKLASSIHNGFEKQSRETGGPFPPDKTIDLRKGACRDLALLFVEACRTMGLATRFVSGYAHHEELDSLQMRHMHAWAEVYLPGGGWRGFDPSIGLAVGGQHVAVAAAADPANAAPTSGTFRGTNARSQLRYSVSIACTD